MSFVGFKAMFHLILFFDIIAFVVLKVYLKKKNSLSEVTYGL